MSRLPQVQHQLAPQQVPLGRKQQHADLALEIRRQLTPQQVNKIHNDFRRMPPQQQAPLLDRGLDPVMFSCYNQATNILEQRSTLQMATVPQLMPAIVPAQQPVTTTQPAVGTQDFPISVDDEEDQRRAALPRNAFPKQDAPPAQEVPPRQEAFPVQEEFPTQEELPFDDPFRDPYMFEELFPEFSFDERTASAQETSPTPENAIIQEASPLQQTTTLPTPPATTATTTATTTPAPQPAASSKPKALDITSRVYAESDRPCEGDVAYPAFCTMNWMNMHSEHFRFNRVAKSHRFYVLDSANADGQSWYCISVLDGSKMYHWELNAQLEALDKAKAEAEAQRLAGRKKRGEANEKKNGCKRKASEPTPASNDNGDEKEGSERKRIKMEGGESMDPLLNFSREPAAVPSTDMAMAEATPLEHQTGNDDEAGLARVGSVQLEDTTNEDDDQREEADNYECQLDIDMNPVAQSGPRPQVSDLFAFLFEPEELTEEADHTEDQTEGSQAEEEPKHEPMVQPVQQQVEQSDEQPEERWVGQSDEQPEKQPEDDLEDEFDRAIKEAMESVEKGDAAEEDAAAEGIDGPEGEPVCDSHSESEWSEEE
ncbi:hypothetical protein B0J12DRAFT_647834 [Macrophomina phaseolina]|uniref:Uncharacterized protein n=1 Tax=Macrophomina phaseolina TaxID=35725 RepID=A0ABQ8GNT3_9PEZI|nr:hypothetical protein B0J12DRAFT_647834 [Macrophomina phaseolina]